MMKNQQVEGCEGFIPSKAVKAFFIPLVGF